MSFTFSPSGRLVFIETLFPPAVRRVVLWAVWGFTFFVLLATVAFAPEFVGFTFIVAAFAIPVSQFVLFVEHGLEAGHLRESLESAVLRVKRGEQVNAALWATGDVVRAFPAVTRPTVEQVLASLLAHPRAAAVLVRLGISESELTKALKAVPAGTSARVSAALGFAVAHAVKRGHARITFSDALIAFARSSPAFVQYLFDHALELRDFDAVVHWEDRREHERTRARAFWSRENLLSVKPFAREWSYGYTPTLNRFSVDLSARLREQGGRLRTLGRAREIQALERALVRSRSANALLVGEPGVGIEDVIDGFAERVRIGASLPLLNYRRVVSVDFGAALAGLKTIGEVAGRVRAILSEAGRAGGTILVVENFPALLRAEADGGGVDLSAALLPYLRGTRVQVIAVSSFTALHETVEKHEALAALFERVEIEEPTAHETLQVLLEVVDAFEERFGAAVPYLTLKAVVTHADRTIQDVPFPRKALDVLETAMIAATGEGARTVTQEHVARVVSERTQIPLGALTAKEQKKLLQLEAFIHERIVDQAEAVRVIAEALRRARAGITAGATTRPIGTFLFLGPTGVGKTETAKALAEVYFGAEKRMLRFDMSEFSGFDAVDRLIGSPGTREEGLLTTAVREQPFSVLLLDEFEKANEKALDLFLPIFDEGKIKDGWGRPVSFTNTLIIATSNAGAEFIRRYIASGKDASGLRDALREEILVRRIFKPELLNRFDGVVVFRPLGMDEVREIAGRLLARFAEHLEREKGVRVVVEDAALGEIIRRGFNQEFGARELRRVLQDTVESIVARRLLESQLGRGDTVTITVEDVGA